MTPKEFIQELRLWKERFENDVLSKFRNNDETLGELAFEGWEKRFTAFLKKYVPFEFNKFERKMTAILYAGTIASAGERGTALDRFLRRYGNFCIAFIDNLIDESSNGYIEISDSGQSPSENKIKNDYAGKILTPSQRLWLETLYKYQVEGKNVSKRELTVELAGKGSPYGTPGAFLRGDKITILGVALVAPESKIVEETNQVIQAVRNLIKNNPNVEKITAKAISQVIGLNEKIVEGIFKNLAELGVFHNSGTNGSDGWESININEKAFEDYNQFESIQEIIEGFIPNKNNEMNLETANESPKKEISRKVFIVHGHDNEAKETVARFLQNLELEPIILHEQANKGKTIIEKFEHHSEEVGFAVILLTPDDVGNVKTKADNLNPRARQNVVFELGYFFAKLKREKVCALYKGGVELPSDFQGVLYVLMDEQGAWKLTLAREIRAAEIKIDMNRI